MPKEIVYGEVSYDEDTDLSTPKEESMYVHVGWSKYGFVQVATVAPKGAIAPFDEEQGRHIIAGGLEPGWFVSLDRDGINALIRNLRKARDAAFGRDE